MSASADTRRAAKSATRLVVPVGVFALGLGGFLFLPNYLLYIGCTAMWMGLVGLAMYLPMAALRELPLNAAALTGLAAYLFAFVAQQGGPAHWFLGAGVAIGVITAVSALAGLGSLAFLSLAWNLTWLALPSGHRCAALRG